MPNVTRKVNADLLYQHEKYIYCKILCTDSIGFFSPRVTVKMKNLLNGNTWLWERGKFITRRYLIQVFRSSLSLNFSFEKLVLEIKESRVHGEKRKERSITFPFTTYFKVEIILVFNTIGIRTFSS